MVEFFRQNLEDARAARAESSYKKTLLQHLHKIRERKEQGAEKQMLTIPEFRPDELDQQKIEGDVEERSPEIYYTRCDSQPVQQLEQLDEQQRESTCASSSLQVVMIPEGSSVHAVADMAIQLKESFDRLHELASADLQLGNDLSAQMAEAKSAALDAIENMLKAVEWQVPVPVANYAKAIESKPVVDSPDKLEVPLISMCRRRSRRRSAVILSETASLLHKLPVRAQKSNRELVAQVLARIRSRDVARSISELIRLGNGTNDEESKLPSTSPDLDAADATDLPEQVHKSSSVEAHDVIEQMRLDSNQARLLQARPPSEPREASVCTPPRDSVVRLQVMEPCIGTTRCGVLRTLQASPNWTGLPANEHGHARESGTTQSMEPHTGATRSNVLKTLHESSNWTNLPASGHGPRPKSSSDPLEQVGTSSTGERDTVFGQACHVLEQARVQIAVPLSGQCETQTCTNPAGSADRQSKVSPVAMTNVRFAKTLFIETRTVANRCSVLKTLEESPKWKAVTRRGDTVSEAHSSFHEQVETNATYDKSVVAEPEAHGLEQDCQPEAALQLEASEKLLCTVPRDLSNLLPMDHPRPRGLEECNSSITEVPEPDPAATLAMERFARRFNLLKIIQASPKWRNAAGLHSVNTDGQAKIDKQTCISELTAPFPRPALDEALQQTTATLDYPFAAHLQRNTLDYDPLIHSLRMRIFRRAWQSHRGISLQHQGCAFPLGEHSSSTSDIHARDQMRCAHDGEVSAPTKIPLMPKLGLDRRGDSLADLTEHQGDTPRAQPIGPQSVWNCTSACHSPHWVRSSRSAKRENLSSFSPGSGSTEMESMSTTLPRSSFAKLETISASSPQSHTPRLKRLPLISPRSRLAKLESLSPASSRSSTVPTTAKPWLSSAPWRDS